MASRAAFRTTFPEGSPLHGRGLRLAAVLLLLFAFPLAGAEDSSLKKVTGAKRRELLADRGRLLKEMTALKSQGKFAEAIVPARRLVALEGLLSGEKDRNYANRIADLAFLYMMTDDSERAEPLYHSALEILQQTGGQTSPEYATTLNNFAGFYMRKGDYARAEPLYRQAADAQKRLRGEAHPDYAQTLGSLGLLYRLMGDYARAEPLCRDAAESLKKFLGEQHSRYAVSLNNLALVYADLGEYSKAAPLLQESLEIRMRAVGEKHPDYATALNNLANLYERQEDYARAEPLLEKALEIRKQVLGESSPACADTLDSLAALDYQRGDYARAELLFQKAMEIRKQVLGEKHPAYADSLNNLANLYMAMGDHARARTLYQKGLEVLKEAVGEKHPDYAESLAHLARLYHETGDFAQAEPLYRRSLEITEKVLGKKQPGYAHRLTSFAELSLLSGDYARAQSMYQEALEIYRGVLGTENPSYAATLANLGVLHTLQGDYARAENLLREALEIRRKTVGDTHLDSAENLTKLADVREWLGDRTGAELLERRALEIRFQSLDRSSAVLSERQQLRMAEMLRFQLDRYLSLALARGRDAGEVYRYVLRWKGAVFTRQRQARFARRNPELKEAVAELQSVSTRLATLALATPDPSKAAVWRRQLEELTDRKERLERDLSAKSAAFRQSREPPDAERLRLLLPAGAALVDLLQYHHHAPSKEQKGRREFEERLIAFVARSDAPIARVELGPAAPIQQCVDRWRKALRGGPDAEQAGKRLRELVWDPLQTRLAGATTVLVSPDGPLARFPLAALPGTKPGSYLLEDVGLGVVPVPRMLFDLLAPAQGASHGKQPAGSLLAVGAVDYDGQPGEFDAKMLVRSAVRSGERMRWSRLEGTRQEALAVRESFLAAYPEGQVRLLGGGRATEEALRQQAPQYRFLHLATHGFFAPASLRSSLGPVYADPSRLARPDSGLFGRQGVASFHPGLLSGLVVTGANQPPRPGCDDGILTAQEVAELDLGHVELAVLSACETGLGETAGGEGVLGLQRAFQVAGTTSTVTSLWQVDDAGTQTLMTEFYRNLWEKRLGKLDALRQAQLAMLRRYDPAQRKLIPRGLQAVEPQSAERPAASCYYWAAFVLSGDWR